MTTWHLIKDVTPPQDGTLILLHRRGSSTAYACRWGKRNYRWNKIGWRGYPNNQDATHWASLTLPEFS